MKIFILGSAALAAMIAGPAMAADMPLKAPPVVAPVYSWTGFYVGVSAGYGWGNGDVNPVGTGLGNPALLVFGSQNTANAMAAALPAQLSANPKGFIGGAQIGYNYQVNKFVWGIETDFSGANIKGSSGTQNIQVPIAGGGSVVSSAVSAEQKLNSLGTVRGRLGFTPTDRLLAYATTTIAQTINPGIIPSPNPAVGSGSAMRTGWTIGGGAEYAFAPRWSFKAEYLYYDLGHLTYVAPMISTTAIGLPGQFSALNVVSTTHFNGNIMRVGINYKFD
jgi:outer membrane immunogenic protein